MVDLKITQLTADTSPTSDDLIVTVDAPGTAPTDKKVAISDLFSLFPTMTMARQAIINGGFDVSQRNGVLFSSANPGNNAYLIDRWQVFVTNTGTLPTTITHSQQTHTAGDIWGAYYFYRIAPNGAGSGFGTNDYYQLAQKIENGTRFLCGASKKVTVSFWARSSIANKRIGLALTQNYGSGGSPTAQETLNGSAFTLTSSWAKYTLTFTTNTLVGKTFGSNNDDYLALSLFNMWGTTVGTNNMGGASAETFVGSGNIDISQVQVCAGDTALPYFPKSSNQELLDCQRYYERPEPNMGTFPIDTYSAAWRTRNPGAGTAGIDVNILFRVVKRISPSATNAIRYDVADGASTTGNATTVSPFNFMIEISVGAGAFCDIHDWVADAEL